jgi:hypothetical protein
MSARPIRTFRCDFQVSLHVFIIVSLLSPFSIHLLRTLQTCNLLESINTTAFLSMLARYTLSIRCCITLNDFDINELMLRAITHSQNGLALTEKARF